MNNMAGRIILAVLSAFCLFAGPAIARSRVGDGPYFCLNKQEREYCVNSHNKPVNGQYVMNSAQSGGVVIGYFKNGYRRGLTSYYDRNGYLEQKVNYNKGNIVGKVSVFSVKGKKIGEFTYSRGMLKQGYCLYGNKKRYLSAEAIARISKNRLVSCR